MGKERRSGFSHEVKQQIREAQKNLCAVCGSEAHLTIHHKIPSSRGGTDTIDNGVGLCRTPCHDLVDILTVEQYIPFEKILKEGIEHFLPINDDL